MGLGVESSAQNVVEGLEIALYRSKRGLVSEQKRPSIGVNETLLGDKGGPRNRAVIHAQVRFVTVIL